MLLEAEQSADDLEPAPREWQEREDRVDGEVQRRHGHEKGWKVAQEQSERMGALLSDGAVETVLYALRAP